MESEMKNYTLGWVKKASIVIIRRTCSAATAFCNFIHSHRLSRHSFHSLSRVDARIMLARCAAWLAPASWKLHTLFANITNWQAILLSERGKRNKFTWREFWQLMFGESWILNVYRRGASTFVVCLCRDLFTAITESGFLLASRNEIALPRWNYRRLLLYSKTQKRHSIYVHSPPRATR